ncbi:MAG: hypothetical protein H6907_20560 [Hyphomicrobiales bacterium]|nr:hypothetical protein [Hyphomicrobiales bacterium]
MGYLVGREAANPNVDESAFLEGALSMQNIEVYARSIDAKHALFLLDACFAGSVFDATRAIPHVIREKTGWPVRQFITSGTAEQEVPDRSIFRDLFIRALDGEGDLDGDGYLTGTELGHYLETNVTNYSRRAQTPQYGKLRDPLLDRGDFVFVTGKAAPPLAKAPAAASAPAATDRETVFWQSVRDSDNPALYRAYLEQYPAGVYAPIARVRLHALESIHPGTPEAPQAVEAATRTSTDSTRIPPSPKAATKETGGAATGDAARPTPSIKPLLEKLATLSGDARVSRLSEIVPGMGPGLTASDVAALLGNLTGSHRGQALQVLDPVIPNSLKPSEFSMLAGNVDTRIRYELLRSMRSKIGAPLTADGIVELYGPAVGGWRLDFLNLFAGHLPDRLSIEGVTTLVETTDIRVRYDMLKVLAPQLPRTLGRKDLLTLWGRDATGGWRRDFLNLFANHLPDGLSIEDVTTLVETTDVRVRYDMLRASAPRLPKTLGRNDLLTLWGREATGGWRRDFLNLFANHLPDRLSIEDVTTLVETTDVRVRYDMQQVLAPRLPKPLGRNDLLTLWGRDATGGWRRDFLNLFANHLPDRLSIEDVTTLVETTDVRVRYDMLRGLAPRLPKTLGRNDLLTLWGRDATGGWRRDFLNLFAGHLPDRLSIEDITTLVETTDVRVRYDITRTLAGRLPKTLSVADVEALIGPATGGWRLSFLRDLAQKISPPPTQNGIETLLASLSGRERTAAQELFRTSAK